MQNETKYTLISNLSEIDTVLSNTSIIGLDIETGGLIAKESKLRLIQIADEHGNIYILDCFNFNLKDISNTLKPHLENKNLKIVIHNAKFEYSWINYHLGIELNSFFDTYLASLLLDFEAEAKLGPVLEAQLGIAIDKTEQKSDWLGVLSNSQLQYAANDVKYLIELRKVMYDKLEKLEMFTAAKLEFDIVPVVAGMESVGFPVNRQRFEEFIAKTEIERDEGKAKLSHFLMSEGGKKDYYRTYTIDLFGNEVETDNESSINIRSSKQLLEKFEAAGINIDSTNKKFVSVYAKQYPDLALLINFRDKEKLCSTYGREFVSKYVKEDDRVYPSYFQLGTVTSRFSASSPNSTNQPHSTEFRRLFAPKTGRKFQICLSEDTLITTNNGFKRIKDIVPNQDKALQEDGSFVNISRLIDNGKREVYEIRTECGYSVKATDNHRFQILDKNADIVWKEVKDLIDGDYLILKAENKFEGAEISFPPIEFTHFNNNRNITVPETLDCDFAELLGLIVGNGSFEGKYSVLRLCIFWNDLDVIDRVRLLLQKYFNPDILRETRYRGVHEFSVNSRPLLNWLLDIGLSKSKLPKFIFSATPEIIGAFLRGYYETDGSISYNEKNKRSGGSIKLVSSRQKIIEDVQTLLLRFGILSASRNYINKSQIGTYLASSVTISKSFAPLFQKYVGFVGARKNGVLQESVESCRERGGNYGGIPNLRKKVIDNWEYTKNFVPTINIRHAGAQRQLTRNSVKEFDIQFPSLRESFNTKYLSQPFDCHFMKFLDKQVVGEEQVYDITVPETSKFIANGFVTHNCDYAQYEMRVLANYALDSIMINAFEAGQDLHSVTTANLFNIPYEECTLPKNKEKRNTAKQINFALAYGIGPQGLALRLQGNGIDVNEDECKVLIDKWYEAYPDAGKWLKKQRYLVNNLIKKSKAGQKVCIDLRTLDNRILKVPFIVGDFSSEAGAKRNCMNWCIQNANALSTKRAMINIHKELKDKNLDAAIVNAIHDELICESSEKDAQETAEIVERCMVEAGNFYLPHVKVEAECKVVDDWSQK